MRVPSSNRGGRAEFNMTPMIDVVFLLIIFFLVSSHLAKQEVHLDLPLPSAESGEKRTDESSPRLTINVLGNGQLVVAGRRVTADELPPGAAPLRIQTRLNGETLQDSNTGDMVFDTATLVSALSEVMTLEPGNIIPTGTPPGVGRKP